MKQQLFLIAAAASALLLTGCGDDNDPGERARRPEAMPTLEPAQSLPTSEVSPSPSPVETATPTTTPSPGASPTLDTRAGAIPSAFRGIWGVNAANCGRQAQLRLDVEPERLVFYESAAEVRRAERISDLVLRLDLAFTGEGESWRRSNTLVLLDGGNRLRREQPDMDPVIYTRCPNE